MPSKPIQIRFTDNELKDIDRVRGEIPRGTWIKALCASAVAARTNFGRACVLEVVAREP